MNDTNGDTKENLKKRLKERRSHTRNHVLNVVYQFEFYKDNLEQALYGYYDAIFYEEEMELEKEDNDFLPRIININIINEQIKGIIQNLDEIDNIIKKNSIGWDINRMDKIDLAILRLAIYEIKFDSSEDGIQKKIAINEAIELAKEYSSKNASKFINGILAKV